MSQEITLSIEGKGVSEVISQLKSMQTLLGIVDIGEMLAFCVNITNTAVENAQQGGQLAFYYEATDECILYESPYLMTLSEIAAENQAPEAPPE